MIVKKCSPLLIACFLANISPAKAYTTEYVCNQPDGFDSQVKQHIQSYKKAPDNIDAMLQMSKSLESLGLAEKALTLADKALEKSPDSGVAVVAKIHALHLAGKTQKAQQLAEQAFENKNNQYQFPRRLKSWLRHSLLSMYLTEGQFDKVESLVLEYYPKTLDLAKRPVKPNSLQLGVPLHTLEALIHAYRQTGKTALANQLARHLKGFSAEGFFAKPFEQLAAPQKWMLASIWAADPNRDKAVIKALKGAFDGGFIMGWRFNYSHHPVYWPQQQTDGFKQMLAGFESKMTSVQKCLKTDLKTII